ncbi:MAG: hypothetical protein P4M15_15570 [Alphaproteobacteria bacterium]|nr:hypothetical protein [Alphaproteobacteria bacterium]
MTAQANMPAEYARTVDVINDAPTTQKGVWLAAINKNRNMTARMSRVAR